MESGRLAMAVAMLGAALPGVASAQDAGPVNPVEDIAGQGGEPDRAPETDIQLTSAPRTYYPSDFADIAPRTALEVVEQVPGFNIDDGGGGGGSGGFGNDARGFGEASGNLLINGDRISSKSTSVRDELSRIPVSNVIRVEIVDGATLEIPGLSGQVANVIVETSGMSGQFSWNPQFSTGPANPGLAEGNVSLRGSTRGIDFSIALGLGAFVRGSEGAAIFTNVLGVDERFNVQTGNLNRPTLTGNFAFDVAPDVSMNINLSGGLHIFRSREREVRTPSNPLPLFDERFRTKNNEHFYELGADIDFPFGPGRMKLIALESFNHGNLRSQSRLDLDSLPETGNRYRRLRDTGERIARAEYSWGMLGGDWQLSGEAAFNRLDNVASLFLFNDAQDDFIQIPFPEGVGGVREERFESILSYGTGLTDNLSIQLTVGGEYSTLSQTGVNALSRTFQRPKGSVSFAWSPGGGFDVSVEVAHRVGQLDFGDFLASVNLSEENESTGNNQLRPQQSWESELEVSKNFGRWGSATLAVFDHRVEDFLIIVPTGNGGEARGNIASATRQGVRINGRLELAPLGFNGAQLDVRLTAEDSSLIDPVTFIDRRFDGNSPFELRLDFRHDVPSTDWAWGLEFRDTQHAPRYRVAEQTLDANISTFGAVYIENKDVFGLTVRARAANLFNGTNILERTIYDGPRDISPVLFTENRRLKIGTVFNLYVSGTF